MTEEIVESDETKNRLIIVINGFYTLEDVIRTGEKILTEAKKLKPGFTIINDIRKFKPTSPVGAEEIRNIQFGVLRLGASTVVRVVGDTNPANMQLNQQSRKIGYEAVAVKTMEEAEEYLDNL